MRLDPRVRGAGRWVSIVLVLAGALGCRADESGADGALDGDAEAARGAGAEAWEQLRRHLDSSLKPPRQFSAEGLALVADRDFGLPLDLAFAVPAAQQHSEHCGVAPQSLASLVRSLEPLTLQASLAEARSDRTLLREVSATIPPDAYVLELEFCRLCRSVRLGFRGRDVVHASDWTKLDPSDWPDTTADGEPPTGELPDVSLATHFFWDGDLGEARALRVLSWNGDHSASSAHTSGIDSERPFNVVGPLAPLDELGPPRRWPNPVWVLSLRLSRAN